MAVQTNSRYVGSAAYLDSQGRLFLGDRIKFPFRNLSDNEVYTVRGRETLRSIAATHYSELSVPPRFFAASLYFVIVDFQPEDFDELQDPWLPLIPGTTLILPSSRTVTSQIFPNLNAALAEFRDGL
jgi:hypothetical protein